MLALKKIPPLEFEIYADRAVLLEQTYPEELRAERDDIIEMFNRSGAIALAAEEQGVTAGIIIGYPLEADELEGYNLEDLYLPEAGSIYLETITVDESFRGKGVGLFIIRGFAEAAYTAGYRTITGHFRKNGSRALIKKIGGREIREEKNWFGTGEDFVYCEASLPVQE